MTDHGWVKLHRKLGNNKLLMHDETALAVFIKLLIFCDSNGQYAGGRRQIAAFFEMNPSTLYKVLQRLQRNRIISVNSNRRYTVYNICNWSTYQQNGNRPNKLLVASGEPAGNQRVTSGEHLSKIKKENKNKNPEGFQKSKTLDKKIYAQAVKVDKELEQKEQRARGRPVEGPGLKAARKVASVIKSKQMEVTQ